MSITVELPTELETALRTKAENQGLSVPDFLLLLARQEAESGSYTSEEVSDFLQADVLSTELTAKVHRLLGK